MGGKLARRGRQALLVSGLCAASAWGQSLDFESVIVSDDLVGASTYEQSFRAVVLSDSAVATLSYLEGLDAVVFHQRTGSSWSHAAIAVADDTTFGGSQTFGEFSSLSLAGATPRLTFVSASSGGFGIYQRDIGGSSFPVFEQTGSSSLLTRSGLAPMPTAANAAGKVLFGQVDGSTQSLQLGDGATVSPLNTSGIGDFNETGTFLPVLPIKRVITPSGVAVALATNSITSETAIYELIASGAPAVRVAASTNAGGKTYRPRQALGANVANTLFVADVDGDADTGQVVYQVGSGGPGDYRPIGSEFAIVGAKKPGGTMTANGNAAFYVPRTTVSLDDDSSIYFYQPTMSSAAELGVGDAVGSFTLDAIGAFGIETAPMVNDAGWVVFDASVSGGSAASADAYIAWNPLLNTQFVVAHVGGTIEIDGTTCTVTGLTALGQDPVDADPFKDALGDDSRLALALTWEDEDLVAHDGVVMVDLNSAVPEPVSVAWLLPVMLLVGRRRPV